MNKKENQKEIEIEIEIESDLLRKIDSIAKKNNISRDEFINNVLNGVYED